MDDLGDWFLMGLGVVGGSPVGGLGRETLELTEGLDLLHDPSVDLVHLSVGGAVLFGIHSNVYLY